MYIELCEKLSKKKCKKKTVQGLLFTHTVHIVK